MQLKSDAQLLREYAHDGAEGAFTEIVTRHTNLVYSAALRQTESPDMAAEITQRVFIGLAQGARTLLPRLTEEASVAGWLCRSARNISLNLRRDEFRQHSRERQAMEQFNPMSETALDWERLRPVLDEAMSELSEADYDALVMRFFNNQDLRAIGQALGVTDDTAQKRMSRALHKLRELLSRRGITSSAAALSIVLSTNAVLAAPAGLAATISSAAALTGTAVYSSSAVALIKNIAMTTIQKTLIVTSLVAAIGTGFYEAHRASHLQEQTLALRLEQDSLAGQLQQEREEAAVKLAAAQQGSGPSRSDLSNLLKLRAEVARLRGNARELAQLKAAAASNENDPAASEMKSWLDRVKKLKERLAQMPDQKIPEFQFLTDQDWLHAVRDLKQLETDADFGRAVSALRNSAQENFAGMVQGALRNYAQAHNGQPPADMSQLQPYFASAVDDSVLQRYEFSQSGTVATKPNLLDGQDDQYFEISTSTITGRSMNEITLQPAMNAFSAANNGQTPTAPSQLLPYVNTPAQQAALQKLIQSAAAQ